MGKGMDDPTGSYDDLTCYSRTALHCASYGGFADTMSLLLDAQANPNLQDHEVKLPILLLCIISLDDMVCLTVPCIIMCV